MAQKQASENTNISTPTETSSPQQSEDEGPILIKPTNGG